MRGKGRGESALALLVLGILADDAPDHLLHAAAAADDETTVFADGLDGGADFHEAEGEAVGGVPAWAESSGV